jgi:CRISPR/Cas system-associated exonuclease Cas4 (RecB family)
MRVIRASEVAQYAYCAKAWWLGSVQGVASSNTRELAHGEHVHRAHGRRVWLAGVLRVAALAIVAIAAIVLLASVWR